MTIFNKSHVWMCSKLFTLFSEKNQSNYVLNVSQPIITQLCLLSNTSVSAVNLCLFDFLMSHTKLLFICNNFVECLFNFTRLNSSLYAVTCQPLKRGILFNRDLALRACISVATARRSERMAAEGGQRFYQILMRRETGKL